MCSWLQNLFVADQSWYATTWGIEILKSLLSMTGIAIGGLIAILAYFRQKEYELVKQRYLEAGIDVLIANFYSMNGAVSNNYARCLQVLRSFRESVEFFEEKELDIGFVPPKEFSFQETAHIRLKALIGSDEVWNAYLIAIAKFQSANTFLAFEVPQAIRIKLKSPDKMNIDRETLANRCAEEARKRHDAIFRFAPIASGLHLIARVLEEQRLSFKAISKVRHHRDVIEAIRKIEELNAAEIPSDEEESDESTSSDAVASAQ